MKEIPLRYVALVIAGQSPAGSEVHDLENGLAFIQGNAEFGAYHPAPRLQCDSPPKSAFSGDILVSVRAPVGALNWCDREIGIGRGVAAIRVRSGADSRFIYRCMEALRVDLQSRGTGSTFQAVTVDDLLDFRVPNRSLDEQQRIADFLDDRVARIDRIVASRRDQIELLADAQRAVADSVLRTAGDVSTTRFGYYIRAIEQGWSPQCDSAQARPGEWGVLKVSAVWAGEFRPHENKALPADLDPLRQYEVGPGDLLVSRANTPTRVGAFGVVPEGAPEKLILCDKLMRLTLDGRVTADFANLFGQTKNVRDALSGSGTGTSGSMVNIRGADIRDLRIPVMDTERQGQLVSRWRRESDVLLSGKATIERQIVALNEYKQSLITAAVTGEFDVTTASTKIPREQA